MVLSTQQLLASSKEEDNNWQAFSLRPKRAEGIPSSGALRLLFPLPGTLSRLSHGSPFSLTCSQLRCHSSRGPL